MDYYSFSLLMLLLFRRYFLAFPQEEDLEVWICERILISSSAGANFNLIEICIHENGLLLTQKYNNIGNTNIIIFLRQK